MFPRTSFDLQTDREGERFWCYHSFSSSAWREHAVIIDQTNAWFEIFFWHNSAFARSYHAWERSLLWMGLEQSDPEPNRGKTHLSSQKLNLRGNTCVPFSHPARLRQTRHHTTKTTLKSSCQNVRFLGLSTSWNGASCWIIQCLNPPSFLINPCRDISAHCAWKGLWTENAHAAQQIPQAVETRLHVCVVNLHLLRMCRRLAHLALMVKLGRFTASTYVMSDSKGMNLQDSFLSAVRVCTCGKRFHGFLINNTAIHLQLSPQQKSGKSIRWNRLTKLWNDNYNLGKNIIASN